MSAMFIQTAGWWSACTLTLSKYERGHLLRHRLELRQKGFAQRVAGGARRMSREIERADALAVAVDDRHGDRAQAAFKLLVDDGKPLAVVVADALVQGLQIGDRRRRQRLEANRHEPAPDLGVVEKAELDAAHGRMKRRQPASHRQRG